ncbi:MAG: S9 family peptidase, partial [bacterium]|nr:S9 family peptidase [bacterium]
MTYPATQRSNQTDHYHGVSVADPYRWLEEPDSAETKAWVKAENELTFGYLAKLKNRSAIRGRLTELWNYERFGLPVKRGDYYFYTRNDGLQNQSVLFVADSLNGKPRQLIDPNAWSEDGSVDLANWTISKDGKLLAYAQATAGSDWKEWRVLDVASGEPLSDHLKWVKFSGVSWTPDSKGFYYSRYAEPAEGEEFTASNYHQKLYYHRLGEPQSA